jgi:hypothetical protein
MLAKPKLQTVALQSPPDAEPVALAKGVTVTSSTPFEGQPDPNSPAQRTLHQALANRLVGQANVYHGLREYAFRTVWGFRPEAIEVTITLAIAHQSHGPRFAVVVKNAQWTSAMGDALVDAGWHVLLVDPTSIVQSSGQAVSDILAVVRHFAGLPLGTGELPERALPSAGPEAPSEDAYASRRDTEAQRASYRAKVPATKPKPRQLARLPLIAGLVVLLTTAAGLYVYQAQSPGTTPAAQAAAYSTRLKSVQVTKEGHAAVTLADGRKVYVPAQSVRKNPNLLHDIIVAWRQGRSLNVFTTTKQHLKYGREIGIKVQGQPSVAPKKP